MTTPPPVDDIPEARREALLAPSAKPTKRHRWLWLWLPLALVGGGLGAAQLIWPLATANESERASSSPLLEAINTTALGLANVNSNQEISQDAATAKLAADEADTLLGHRRYPEANANALVLLSPKSKVLLKPEAAEKLSAMLAQAKRDGVQLGVISGFRTYEDQEYLFFDVKAERGETSQTRADVSAPPGYSEHHTGYAVDFTDLTQPQTDLERSFEQTPGFQWLQRNAAFYGFELSFPPGNVQGLSYEPWHWRFVGNQESLETFYRPE